MIEDEQALEEHVDAGEPIPEERYTFSGGKSSVPPPPLSSIRGEESCFTTICNSIFYFFLSFEHTYIMFMKNLMQLKAQDAWDTAEQFMVPCAIFLFAFSLVTPVTRSK